MAKFHLFVNLITNFCFRGRCLLAIQRRWIWTLLFKGFIVKLWGWVNK